MNKDYRYYLLAFANLNTNKREGKNAPHKTILLLSIINLIDAGLITDNKILLNEELQINFSCLWREFVGDSSPFKCDISMPFFYMKSEPFWQLQKSKFYEEKMSYSLKDLKSNFDYAIIDNELFHLIQNSENAIKFRVFLIAKYIYPLWDYDDSIFDEKIKSSKATNSNCQDTKKYLYENNTLGVYVYQYTPKSVLVGGNTKPIKDALKELHGTFNNFCDNGKPCWIYSAKRLIKIIELLDTVK